MSDLPCHPALIDETESGPGNLTLDIRNGAYDGEETWDIISESRDIPTPYILESDHEDYPVSPALESLDWEALGSGTSFTARNGFEWQPPPVAIPIGIQSGSDWTDGHTLGYIVTTDDDDEAILTPSVWVAAYRWTLTRRRDHPVPAWTRIEDGADEPDLVPYDDTPHVIDWVSDDTPESDPAPTPWPTMSVLWPHPD